MFVLASEPLNPPGITFLVFQRVVTGVLAAVVALAAILWREPWGLAALGGLVLVAASFEAGSLAKTDQRGTSLFVAVALLVGVFFSVPDQALLPVLACLWLLGNLTQFVRFPNFSAGFLGFTLWVVVALLAAVVLQIQSKTGTGAFAPNLLLLALVPLWVGDSLAYFVGKSIGKHKLAPSISPNKTWEGAIANLVGCIGAALALGAWLSVPTPASVAVGLSTGILGQVGDLLQSRLKRQVGVKDSGSILPGHGGVLDRLDSFLYSCYPSLLALWLLAPGMFHVKQWPW